jgi:hypothetical protein
MPPDDEDRAFAPPPASLSGEERAELEAALAAARRDEFSSEAAVKAMYARHDG